MPLTREDVFATLRGVKDPELGINIVDLGLVYSVEITASSGKERVHITMTLTSPGCPLGTAIVAMIRDALARFPSLNPEQDVTVEIVFDPPWTVELMSEEAKAELGF